MHVETREYCGQFPEGFDLRWRIKDTVWKLKLLLNVMPMGYFKYAKLFFCANIRNIF